MSYATVKTFRKIGQNRGKPRLWIEGKALNDAGLSHGARWVLVEHLEGFDISQVKTAEKKHDGRRVRKIAGTSARPVIDIAAGSLDSLRVFDAMPESVSLEYVAGSGRIEVRRDLRNALH